MAKITKKSLNLQGFEILNLMIETLEIRFSMKMTPKNKKEIKIKLDDLKNSLNELKKNIYD